MQLNRKSNQPPVKKSLPEHLPAPLPSVENVLERVQRPVEFTNQMRQKFVDLAQLYWPNIGKICGIMGISRVGYYMARHRDPIFRSAIDEIAESRIDEVEERVLDDALHSKAFISQITLLKGYRPDRYDRAKKVQVDHSHSKVEKEYQEIFDAEVVEDKQLGDGSKSGEDDRS